MDLHILLALLTGNRVSVQTRQIGLCTVYQAYCSCVYSWLNLSKSQCRQSTLLHDRSFVKASNKSIVAI